MLRGFRKSQRFLIFLGLLSISLRIFTGAAEAQVNFTSLIVDQNIYATQHMNPNHHLHGDEIKSNTGASSIPEKHRTYSTYKKYISPDNYFANLSSELISPKLQVPKILYTDQQSIKTLTYRPTSHSPPAVVSARLHTHTTTTVHSVVLEKKFGEFKDSYSWGVNSFSLRY